MHSFPQYYRGLGEGSRPKFQPLERSRKKHPAPEVGRNGDPFAAIVQTGTGHTPIDLICIHVAVFVLRFVRHWAISVLHS